MVVPAGADERVAHLITTRNDTKRSNTRRAGLTNPLEVARQLHTGAFIVNSNARDAPFEVCAVVEVCLSK